MVGAGAHRFGRQLHPPESGQRFDATAPPRHAVVWVRSREQPDFHISNEGFRPVVSAPSAARSSCAGGRRRLGGLARGARARKSASGIEPLRQTRTARRRERASAREARHRWQLPCNHWCVARERGASRARPSVRSAGPTSSCIETFACSVDRCGRDAVDRLERTSTLR
jgi:hypothetical protein